MLMMVGLRFCARGLFGGWDEFLYWGFWVWVLGGDELRERKRKMRLREKNILLCSYIILMCYRKIKEEMLGVL